MNVDMSAMINEGKYKSVVAVYILLKEQIPFWGHLLYTCGGPRSISGQPDSMIYHCGPALWRL